MLRISKTSKLDGILSWSLQAIDTCPGSKGRDGQLVEACRGCYATTGNYRFANVKAPRLENRDDWKRDAWVDDMAAALESQRYFRWFDSGDCYDYRLAEKILAVVQLTPWVKHWIPTRMHKFPKVARVLERIAAQPNAVVRYSADEVFTASYSAPKSGHYSGIIADASVRTDARVCEAYSRDGKCGGCRACWDKSVGAIAYPAHGAKMSKVINIKLAA